MSTSNRGKAWQLDDKEVADLVAGTHLDPFSRLGIQAADDGYCARAFIPGADRVEAASLDGHGLGSLGRRHPAGFFEGKISATGRQLIRFNCANAKGSWSLIDPYSFGPVLGPMDDFYLAEGTHLRLFDRLGAHLIVHGGVDGVHFAVWAPSASRVSVVGDFNQWDGRRHVMRHRLGSGMWEIFVPELGPGTVYKFELTGPAGALIPLKADPYALASEMRPKTASVVADPAPHHWSDSVYLAARSRRDQRRAPMSIYEA